MSTIELGLKPEGLHINLSTDSDLYATITLYDDNDVASSWPVGTTLTIEFPGSAFSAWTATLVTSVATFQVDKAIANTITNRTPARLRYVNGTTDRVLAVGVVRRHDAG